MTHLCEYEGNPFPCGDPAYFELRREGSPWRLCQDHARIFHEVPPVCDECGASEVSCGYRWWDGFLGELVLSGVCGACADMIRADDPDTEFEPVAVTA